MQGARSNLLPELTSPGCSSGGGSLNVLDSLLSYSLNKAHCRGLPTHEFEPLQLDEMWEDDSPSPATSEPLSPEYVPEKESGPLFLAPVPTPFFASY